MDTKKTLNTLLAGAVVFTMAGVAGDAVAAEKEKCYGVVKAGHNDCANHAGTHSCAGYAEVDGDRGEWVSVPKGLCEKLVHGSLEPGEGSNEHGNNEG